VHTKWLVIIEVVVGYLLAFLTIMRIVLQRREPTATLAWVLGILLLPYLGVLMYILVGRRRLTRQVRKRLARAAALEPHLARLGGGLAELVAPAAPDHYCKPSERELVMVSNRMGRRLPTCGNEVDLLPDANETYRALEEAILGAKDHVHLLYYIFEQDETGARFRDLLLKKAKEGIAVRVLTDGVGSYGIDSFMIPVVQAGGMHAEFLPVGNFSRHWHPNLRNHRKIAIIDAKMGFTGGVNIGDEYTGRKRRVGRWRDTHIRIRGPAVHHLQEIFAEDWFFASGEDLIAERWFPDQQAVGDHMVQIIASGPDTETQPMQRIFFTAVTSAKERVLLTTPYFVPDQAMIVALETAAMRGVDVRLLLPRKSDMRLVEKAGRSYYDELLANGVKIYEYRSGILHAKSMVVDERWATVGSANMDVRSFQLNFEVNAAIYGPAFANQLASLFERDLKEAQQITLEDIERKTLTERMAESLARVLSPVL
jgi:cardiolipin synthase A/B